MAHARPVAGVSHPDLLHRGGLARLDGAGRQETLLALQRSHGNAAVQQAIARQASAAEPTRPTVRNGSRGAAVAALQQQLNAAGARPPLDADGKFGPMTLAAVRRFQAAAGLDADGVVGPRTWSALDTGGVRILADAVAAPERAPSPKEQQEVLVRVQMVLTRLRGLREGHESGARPAQPARELRTPAARQAGVDGEGSSLDEVASEVGALVDDPAGYVGEIASGVVEAAGEAVGSVVDLAEETVKGLVDWAVETAGEAAGEVGELVEGPVGYLGAVAGKVVATAEEALGELADLPGDLRRRHPEVIAALDEGLKTLGQPFAADIDLDGIKRGLDALLGMLGGLPAAADVVFTKDCQEGYTQVNVADRTIVAHGTTAFDAVEDADRIQGGHVASVLPVFGPQIFCPDDPDFAKPGVVSAYIYVTETRTLPVWKERDNAAARSKEIWDDFLAAAQGHEAKHVAIDRKHFEPMHKLASGKSKNGAIDAFSRVIDNADRENRALDAREGRILVSGSGDVSVGPR